MEQLATKDGDLPLLADTPPVVSIPKPMTVSFPCYIQLKLTGWTFHIDTVCVIAVRSYQFCY